MNQMTMFKLRHDALVSLAKTWLLKEIGCFLVLTEVRNPTGETPDAIGFTPDFYSCMIECIACRSSFHFDRFTPGHSPTSHKACRAEPYKGMGNYRYYLSSPSDVKLNDLPDKWGLLHTDGKIIEIVKEPSPFYDTHIYCNERKLLSYALRRHCASSTKVHINGK